MSDMPRPRPGLYVIALLAFFNSCDASIEARNAREELKRIADAIKQPAQVTQRPHF